MMINIQDPKVELIPLELINVLNPRSRNRKVFQDIVSNIAAVGLKRPITVARRTTNGGLHYELVCGQGRLEAFRALGQTAIPALVIEVNDEDCLLMSLVENVARRQHQALDLLHDIDGMRNRGHSVADIARKTGLTAEYARGVLRLLTTGETRLLEAVENGQIPVSVAVEIADAEDADMQTILQEAYEKNLLRGTSLVAAKRLIAQRRRRGKRERVTDPRRSRSLSVDALVRTYRQDVDKKRLIVRRAETTKSRLLFLTEALRALFVESGFVTVLRNEGLDTLPRDLAERIQDRIAP